MGAPRKVSNTKKRRTLSERFSCVSRYSVQNDFETLKDEASDCIDEVHARLDIMEGKFKKERLERLELQRKLDNLYDYMRTLHVGARGN